MRPRHLLGLLAVVVLLLAIWLVPMALADNGSTGSTDPPYRTGTQAPSGSECPYLEAHPWLDPHGSGGASLTDGAALEIEYY